MHKLKTTAVISSALLFAVFFTSCGAGSVQGNSSTAAVSEDMTFSGITAASLTVGHTAYSIDDDGIQRLEAIISELSAVESNKAELDENSIDWVLDMNNGTRLYRVRSSDGWVTADDTMRIYGDSNELNIFVAEQLSAEPASNSMRESNAAYYSIPCGEPETEEEYVKTAENLLTAWLTSLQSPDTNDYYRNKGFRFAEPPSPGYMRKNNYLACGIVNGVKEFCVELCFTAEDCGGNTFYDKYYQDGRYTAAGTYWSGQYICGRFRYKDGVCSLIDMGTRDDSDRIQAGLNGIPQGGFITFYDFARRSDLEQLTESEFKDYGNFTVSSNMTMTKDGVPLHIDIYGFEKDSETADTVTAVMSKRSYNTDGSKHYSSGVYYTDYGTGQKSITLPKNYKINFDDYNGDGNPDYCTKYDEDENGSYYVLDNIISDGRILNLSGRAYKGGIYLAGCFEPSPRLQKSDQSKYISWTRTLNDGKYWPLDTSGNVLKLDRLNMYSDRYYLPDDMKYYNEDEDIVHCFLWNNTDESVSTDSAYTVESFEGGGWIHVSDGSCSSVTIEPRGYADIAYDISSINDRAGTVYRIVQKCGDLTAYGKFWLRGREVQNLGIDSVALDEGALSGRFTLTDFSTDTSSVTSAQITGDGISCQLLLTENNGTEQGFFLPDGQGLPAGTYTLTINNTVSREFTVTNR